MSRALLPLFWRRQTLSLGFCSSRSLASAEISFPREACLSPSSRSRFHYVQPVGWGIRFLLACRSTLHGCASEEIGRGISCSRQFGHTRNVSDAGVWVTNRIWDPGYAFSLSWGRRSCCDGDWVCSLVVAGDVGGQNGAQSGSLRTSGGVGWLGSSWTGVMAAAVGEDDSGSAGGDGAIQRWRGSAWRRRIGGLGALSTLLGDWAWIRVLVSWAAIGLLGSGWAARVRPARFWARRVFIAEVLDKEEGMEEEAAAPLLANI